MDSTSGPLVSVVVPTLNRAQYLTQTIDSILDQDYPDIECIVIDGGSSDDSVAILESYGDCIKWVSEPDNSIADAINKGWRMSKGDILSFLNADDLYVAPGGVLKVVNYLKDHPEVDLVYGDIAGIDDAGRVIGGVVSPEEWDLFYAVKYCHHIIHSPAAFIKRGLLEEINWLDAELPQVPDHDMYIRAGLVGTLKHLPELIAYARQSNGLTQRRDIGESKIRLTRKFFENPDLPPPFNSDGFRRRSISNAYLAASYYCWLARHFDLVARYLLKSLQTDPLNLRRVIAKTLEATVMNELIRYTPRALKRLAKKLVPFQVRY